MKISLGSIVGYIANYLRQVLIMKKKGIFRFFVFLGGGVVVGLVIYLFLKFEPITPKDIVMEVAEYDLGEGYRLIDSDQELTVLKWFGSYSESYVFRIYDSEAERFFEKVISSGHWKLQPNGDPGKQGDDVTYERIFYMDGDSYLVIARAKLNDKALKVYIYTN